MTQDGADTLRMLQFLELAHLQVMGHAPGGKSVLPNQYHFGK